MVYFDSYIKPVEDLVLGDYRLLIVDNRLVLPVDLFIRLIITSSDVIHAWSVPRYFLKLDAVSGNLTVINYSFNTLGLFFGQCSEICGANHSFIPIILEVTLFNFFKN